jgi:hypothetical protein
MSARRVGLLVGLVMLISGLPARTAEGWPDVFDPFRVLTLHLEMASGDWSAVQADADFNDPRPAQFWADGELPIAVTVKRKSDPPLGPKVSLKIDINDTVPGQSWRNLKKLSLENGAEGGIVKEGVAWQMHRLAGDRGFYGYSAAKAAWVRLYVNGELIGVYTHAEERDKQMIQNRGMWKENATWLYKNDPNPVLEATSAPGNSPTFNELCYTPFNTGCAQPNLESNLVALIDMQGMLTLGAIEAFAGNRDGLFTHDGKNHFFADFAPNRELKRRYFPWDLDTGLSSTTSSILGWAGDYQSQILGHYWFRSWFLHTMTDLINDPLSAASLTTFLNQLEPVLTPVLQEDVNNGLEGDVAGHFASLRQWVTNRISNVRGQVGPIIGTVRFTPTAGEMVPGTVVALTHTNVSGTIYYTLDGTDPRALGGTPAGQAYSNSLTLNDSGHIMARVLIGTNWSALRQATFNVANHAAALKVTEIHYAPRANGTNDDGGEHEFIELQNQSAAPINLSGYEFDGLTYQFAPGTMIAPSNHVLLVRNAVAFTNRHPGVSYHGIFGGALDSNGEKIRLRNSDGNNVFSVEYNNKPPWPLGANKLGWSLVNQNPDGNPDDPENWRASANVHGSPGTTDPIPPYGVGVVINEVLAHTDLPQEDAIELYNPTTNTIDISGWYLSDKVNFDDPTGAVLKRYRIPDGTLVPSQGFAMFYEGAFNSSTNGTNKFAISAFGEQVYLASASNGTLNGYVVGAEFDATDNGVSLGRYVTSRGKDFATLDALTFGLTNPATLAQFRAGPGATNSGPRIGPIVINEIMYHPGSNGTEFIELFNSSSNLIDLAAWKIGGANHIFPLDTFMPAGSFLILIGTTNISPEAFRSAHNVPLDVPVFSVNFDLGNNGEVLTLYKPNYDTPLAYVVVDYVRFNDRAPWPTEADGAGFSLEKMAPHLYGNEPHHWRTYQIGGSPGRANGSSNITVLAFGSAWKFSDLSRHLGTPWRTTNYSDSGWTEGAAPLGRTYSANTIFSNPLPGRVTTYFRKEFSINDRADKITNLTMQANYDDGFVAYLNGTEIARRSLSAGTILSTDFASAHAGGGYESISLDAFRSSLHLGANHLAVELHQSLANDTNIVWDAELTYQVVSSTVVEPTPFRITTVAPLLNAVTLEWESLSGVHYRIQQSESLDIWADATSDILATNTLMRLTVPVTNSPSGTFFRIKVIP